MASVPSLGPRCGVHGGRRLFCVQLVLLQLAILLHSACCWRPSPLPLQLAPPRLAHSLACRCPPRRRASNEEPILTRTVSNLSNSSEIELSDGPSLADGLEGGSPRSSHGATPRFGNSSRQPGFETIVEGEERPGSTGSATPQRRKRSGVQVRGCR